MSDETTLLSCPFCGKPIEVFNAPWADGEPGWTYWHVDEMQAAEDKCPLTTACYDTKKELIEAWNTRAERTCEVESKTFIEGEYVPCPYYEYEMECGGQFRWDEVEPPTHCPNCGRKVVDEC